MSNKQLALIALIRIALPFLNSSYDIAEKLRVRPQNSFKQSSYTNNLDI